jgi:hypothetical protein
LHFREAGGSADVAAFSAPASVLLKMISGKVIAAITLECRTALIVCLSLKLEWGTL